MTRDKFRNLMESFKKARESNPLLSYWEWKNSLPDNLAHTPDWQYNNFGAYTGGLKPELNEDGYYHLGSRNPYTGEILKPKSHPTYDKAILNDAAAGYFPYEKNGITYTKTYSPTGDISGYANGTDGIQSNTSEIPVTYSNGKWNYGYNPGAGFLKPVVSIQDAADLTPVGNAITANDVYQSASQGDYITAGLIGAAALLPGAISKPLKKIVREIPSVNPKYFSDKINKVLGREVRPNGLSRDVYTDAINQRNRVIEDLYTDLDYWDRVRAINEQYGDDYTKVYKGVLDTYENKYTGLPEPKAKQFFGDAKAEMAARKDAMERFRMNKIPAGYTDFEYNISPHLDRIDRPTALHELGHYVDFNLSQNANADYNNNMFSALRKDLSTDSNPLYPDKTDYFRQGTELKSYMNTLRSYMLSIGLMDRPGLKVTTKTIKRAINSLPSEMNAVRAAYLQFNSPGEYTKWFNKIPLLSIPGAAMYFGNKEDNSYADGTDGIKYYGAYSPKQQAYVLPVYDDKGENNVVLPEVTVTPLNNTDLTGYMLKGDFIKEAMSFTPVGDVEDIYNIGKNLYDKNYALAALGAGLFLLPNILEKPLKKLIPRKVLKELSLEDVKNWTDKDWDANYSKAIKERDNDKVLRIRDLHFMSKVPDNNISIRDGKPTMWFHGSPYAGHTSFNSSVFNNTIGGESALGREKGNFFTTDLNAAKNYATTPSAKSEYSEYTKPKNVKEKLLNIVGLYKPKYIHPLNRVPKDLGIDVKNMHNNEVTPLKLMSMSKSDGSKVYQSNKVYPTYINPGKVYTVDFKGNPWSLSPIEFPSKYYSKESYPDVDLTPTNIYPEGHLIEKYKTSDLTSNLSLLKLELQDLNLPYEHIKYDGSGNKSLYSKYRSWDNKLNFKNLLLNYPNYKERPGYSYSIFEHKYPSTTNGAVLYGASEGYNTIHMPNVIDANTGHYENYPIEDLVPLSSNLIKLANPITYDDSGNIIPISKRDNFNSPDIRYGLIPLLGFGLYNKYNKNKENKSN